MQKLNSIVIDGIKFNVIVNVKKIKKIYMRVKYENNEYYFVINSFKKLSNDFIEELANKHKNAILKLASKAHNEQLDDNQIILLGEVYNKEDITNEMIEEAYNQVINLFAFYKKVFKRDDTLLKFRKMKTRWGVCFTTENRITLTKATINIPLRLTEYIIIHEFCHFKYPNHSKKFYDYVKIYCPDYLERKKELKNFSYTLK